MMSKPKEKMKISHDAVWDRMVRAGWFKKTRPPSLWAVMDPWFYLPSEEEVMAIVNGDDTDRKPYVPVTGDCDNFAFELRNAFKRLGWAVGVLLVEIPEGLHAIFFYCTDDGRVVALEPQSDQEFKPPYNVIGVVMY